MSYSMSWKLSTVPKLEREARLGLDWPHDSSAPSMRELLDGGCVWSWYDAEAEMRALSARFPELRFVLDVVNVEEPGRSPPERWHLVAGKLHKVVARITFDDFDPAKLA